MLLFGLIHGIIYTFLIPPWQHYDEPGQFEHAWLIANHHKLPESGEYDQAMRREVAASMIEHKFFDGMNFLPNLIAINEPIWIGISQTNDPHAYYSLIALPLYLAQTTDITFQLYLGRLTSLTLYLLIIALGYATVVELTEQTNPLRWMMPLTMAMLPSFTDMMTAVNNDVGATAFFSAFLWLSIHTIRRGIHWLRLLGIIALASLCIITKSTVIFALLLAPIPIILSLLSQKRQRKIAWGILIFCLVALLSLIIKPGKPAHWYNNAVTSNAGRTQQTETPQGHYAFKLETAQNDDISQLIQHLGVKTSKALAGKTVSLGGWVWASQPTTVSSPTISTDTQSHKTNLEASQQPTFFKLTAKIEDESGLIRIILQSPHPSSMPSPVTVYFDGLVLVEGDPNSNSEPQFSNPNGTRCTWGTQTFVNLIHNGSAEQAWLGTRRSIDRAFDNLYPASLSTILTSTGDWNGASWYFESSFNNLFRTFWAKFGWGHVSLIGKRPYRPLFAITTLGIIGAIIAAWYYRYTLPKSENIFLLLSGLLIWGATLFRGIESLINTVFIPAARYAYPAIIPTILVFCCGWLTIGQILHSKFKIPSFFLSIAYILFFILVDIISIQSIVQFYIM